ncbi:MAG: rRNA maturation RNase YbeY [Saprospiraceae bacterium]|nr:rRNA maturation RNase YbeY [Saprospiraceae bacterium]
MNAETSANISFFVEEDVSHPFPSDEPEYSKWLNSVAAEENKTISTLTYIFCSDEYLLDINLTYLGHDYYTDIITFPYKEGDIIESDIYISLDRIKENAEEFKVSFYNELKRVMVHGVLHLIGYNDKSEKEVITIREKEDYYIRRFDFLS